MFKLITEITYKIIYILFSKVKLFSAFGPYLLKQNLLLLTMFKIHNIHKINIVIKEIRITINYFLT